MFNIKTQTWEQLLELDLKYIKNILEKNKESINYDDWTGAWCFDNGEEIADYLYFYENTYLNPKELTGYIEEIIEDEMKMKRNKDE